MNNESIDTGYFVTHLYTAAREEFGNYNNGKFKIGEIVTYIGNKELLKEFKNKSFRVQSVNIIDDDVTEYSLAEFPYLIYENELKSL